MKMKSKNFELIKIYSDTEDTYETWEILEGTINTGLTIMKLPYDYFLKNGCEVTLAKTDNLEAMLELMEERYYENSD